MTSHKGLLYLSGGMQHAVSLGSGWRLRTADVLTKMGYKPIDIALLDKMYQLQHGDLMGDMDPCDATSVTQFKSNIRFHFVETDLRLVDRSDALVVYYDESARRGAGTISECQHAYNQDIPVFVVSSWEDWATEVPSWLLAISTKIFTSFDELYDYLAELPDGILQKDVYGNRNSGDYYLCSLTGKPFKKTNQHFVSTISPLYSKEAVKVVRHTTEGVQDRFEFCMEALGVYQ